MTSPLLDAATGKRDASCWGVAAVVFALLLACGVGEPDTQQGQQVGGAECQSDQDCVEGAFCHEVGVCVEYCLTDEHCAEGETCTDGRCILVETAECEFPCPARMQCVQGECLWDCTENADCPGGFACRAGHCEEAACILNEDCAAGTACIDGLCVAVECRENADCDPDSICRTGQCSAVGDCIESEHCGGGHQSCVNGACEGEPLPSSTGNPPPPCHTNLDCGERQFCVDEVCRYSVECTEHAHCPAGEACFRKLCWPL